MLGGDECAVLGASERGNLHEVANSSGHTRACQPQRAIMVDRIEALASGLAQDSGHVDHRIDAGEQGIPVHRVVRPGEVAMPLVGSEPTIADAEHDSPAMCAQCRDEKSGDESTRAGHEHRAAVGWAGWRGCVHAGTGDWIGGKTSRDRRPDSASGGTIAAATLAQLAPGSCGAR